MRIPFDLQKYLTDPTLKVVTSDGDAEARIFQTIFRKRKTDGYASEPKFRV